ncbi:MAG: class I SAM-dependent methyltransferase [Thermodesulfovibrionales bacterium]|nr:class I SAM-dependent methyltransferase [Thermodesulfovibrionales bacterium]
MVCPSWLSFILYNPIRKAFQDRNKVIAESGVTSTSIVLEVGAGNGFLTETLAEHAKKVYAVELQEGMVKKLQRRVHRFGDRVEIIRSDIATYRMQEQFTDVCIMYYSFHEVSDKAEAALNISTAVKLNGLLSIYEPTIEVTKTGMKETVNLFRSVGFLEDINWNNLFTRFIRLRKHKRI